MYLRKAIFEVDFEVLKIDARHMIRDTDQKIFEALSRNFTRNNLTSISRNLEFRIKSGFNLVLRDFNSDLSRFFRLKFSLNSEYLTGADILSDLKWTDIVDDDDLKSLVYNILGDLRGQDLPLHPIEEILKVIFFQNNDILAELYPKLFGFINLLFSVLL